MLQISNKKFVYSQKQWFLDYPIRNNGNRISDSGLKMGLICKN